jgi:hypothetical protein
MIAPKANESIEVAIMYAQFANVGVALFENAHRKTSR